MRYPVVLHKSGLWIRLHKKSSRGFMKELFESAIKSGFIIY